MSIKCRSWHCPDCYHVRKRRLTREALAGRPNTFLTLTSRRRPDKTPGQAAAELAHCWRLIRLRWMRLKNLKALPFIAIFEATKLGWPHLHILLRSKWIEQEKLSEWMAELHDSPVVDIQRITEKGRIAGYCAKYSGKAAHRFANCKRYWSSRDWQLAEETRELEAFRALGKWEWTEKTLATLAADYSKAGYFVLWAGSDGFTATRATGPDPPDPPRGAFL